jgi:high-affinity nickel-transport protein
MYSALSIAVLGFLLGVRHAVDPDHVVAVSTIATRSTSFRRAAGVGALWGVGHTLTIVAVGGAIVFLRVAISPRVGLAMEFSVALMLILLGFQNLASARSADAPAPSAARPFVVGMVHGMAGSAAIALIVLATVSDPWWALAYLALFGLGTVLRNDHRDCHHRTPGVAGRRPDAERAALAHAGVRVASVVLGVMLASELTSRESGLLSATPAWVPR